MKAYQTFGLTLCAIGVTAALTQATPMPQVSPAPIGDRVTAADRAVPPYKHIFVIIAENKAYKQIIGNPQAPRLNQLAQTYGLATKFYGEIHPSEGNYAAMLGGSNFGIHDDDAFYCQAGSVDQFCSHAKRPNYANHTIVAKSLMDQLSEKGLTWKGYFEDLPSPGAKVVVYPDKQRALYAVKHNGFMNYKSVQDDPQIAQKIVGFDQLATDLQTGNLPNYSHIILNQCNEMHGLEECPNMEKLIQQGDAEIGKLADRIMGSSIWTAPENSAIVITFDEDNYNPVNDPAEQGCCGFEPESETNYGGGHIATIVISNHGPRGVVDATPYNHYSLLRTTENAFGITEYLKAAGDTDKGVKSMTKLFATPNYRP